MEKSTGKFARYFKRLLQVETTTGDAGVGSGSGGFSPSNINSTDSYAPGDARVPKALGKVQSRLDSPKKKKKKKKKAIKKVVKVVDEENEEVKVVKVDDISDYM